MELTNEQFQQLTGLKAPPQSPDGDRRQSTRVIFGKRAKIRPLFGDAHDGGKTALLRDVSVAGVGLLLADPMDAGDEFILRVPVDTGGHIYIRCMVRHCQAGGTGGGQFVVGASFELVLDPATLSEEQTADHHERIEVVQSAATVAAGAQVEPDESVKRGFFSAFRSLRDARQAAKLRKRLRSSSSNIDDESCGSESNLPSIRTVQSEPMPTVAAPSPTVQAGRERKSLFAPAKPSVAPAPVVEATVESAVETRPANINAPAPDLELTASIMPAEINLTSCELVLPATSSGLTMVFESFATPTVSELSVTVPTSAAVADRSFEEPVAIGVRARPISQEQWSNRSATRTRHPRSCRRHLAYR